MWSWRFVESESWFESGNWFDSPSWFDYQDWIALPDWFDSEDWFDSHDLTRLTSWSGRVILIYFDDELPLVVSVEYFLLVVSVESWKLVKSETWFESDIDLTIKIDSNLRVESILRIDSTPRNRLDSQDWFHWSLDLVESIKCFPS